MDDRAFPELPPELTRWRGKTVNTRDIRPLQLCECLVTLATIFTVAADVGVTPFPRDVNRAIGSAMPIVALGAAVKFWHHERVIMDCFYKNERLMLIEKIQSESSHAYTLQLQLLRQQHAHRVKGLEANLKEREEVINELHITVSDLKAQKYHEQCQARLDAQQALEELDEAKAAIARGKQELAITEDKLGERILAFQEEQAQFEQSCWDKAKAAMQEQFDGLIHQIQTRDALIGSLQASTPIGVYTREGILAQKVVDIVESLGVILRRTGYDYDGNLLRVWGSPLPYLNGTPMGSMEGPNGLTLTQEMATGIIFTELHPEKYMSIIQGRVPGCHNLPKLKIGRESDVLLFELDLSPVSHEDAKRQAEFNRKYHIPSANESALVEFIQQSLHINFSASTGRGKTTLLDYIVQNLPIIMGSAVKIRYANPKPDRQYKGIPVNFVGADESIIGLFEAAIEIVYRVESNNDILRRNQPLPPPQREPFLTFEPTFYLVDEINALVGHFKSWSQKARTAYLDELPNQLDLDNERLAAYEQYLKPKLGAASMVTDILKIVWRLGRSENIKLLIAGQNLMPSQMGANITKADMNFQSMIYSGLKPIEIAYKDDLIDKDFHALAMKAIAAEKDGKCPKYWAAFIPMDGTAPPSIIKLPPPISPIQVSETEDPDDEIDGEVGAGIGPGCLNPAQANNHEASSDFEALDQAEKSLAENPAFLGVTPAHPDPGPHDAHRQEWFYPHIISSYLETNSIAQTINDIWGLSAGKSRDYQVAKWSVRYILRMCNIQIIEKIRPEDRKRDEMNYRQLINYLDGK